ncbi:DMT family transporter [Cobetia crustatorum]|uniref:DMT family transporter n=1 Tax=Cobetia crustatorum TaxID=553385 RepID=A0A558HHY2_9GAMM|nr:DMT family transporter [Cobetia crustatorum]TVU68742.1 DMT family transporter [Cobetia crustatorum]
MPVLVAYCVVLMVWSTTPLAISWSASGWLPAWSAMGRMLIAACIGYPLLRVMGLKMDFSVAAMRSYIAAALGIWGGMYFAYIAAGWLPSGIMSLLFGLAPLLSGLYARWWLKSAPLDKLQWLGFVLALGGLAVAVSDSLALPPGSWKGVLTMLLAVNCFAASGVLVQRERAGLHPLVQTEGALLVSLPLYFICALVVDGVPAALPVGRPLGAILYLGVFGSLIGYLCYYFVLSRLSASTVALATLITPIFAMSLGATLNGELISSRVLSGALLIVVGLCAYLFGPQWRSRLQGGRITRS